MDKGMEERETCKFPKETLNKYPATARGKSRELERKVLCVSGANVDLRHTVRTRRGHP